jgi:diguanylate cyclase (GGDEF)-like protein
MNRRTDRIAYLKGSYRRLVGWLVVGGMLILAVWGFTLTNLAGNRREAEQQIFRDAASLSAAYARQVAYSVKLVDQITRSVKYEWETFGGGVSLEDELRAGVFTDPSQIQVTIVDAQGRPTTSTAPTKTAIASYAGTEWFQLHEAGLTDGLLVTPPEYSPVHKNYVIRFSRRLVDGGDAFAGIVMVATYPAYFASFYGETMIGRKGFLSLKKNGGTLMVTKKNGHATPFSGQFRLAPDFELSQGVKVTAKEFVDGEPRVVAWNKLADYPLVAVVGLSSEDALAAYRELERNYRRFAIAMTILLIAFAAAGIIFTARLALRREQAAEVRNAYHLAVDAAGEGFYVLQPIYNEREELVDCRIKDCNERGAYFVNSNKSDIRGVMVSEFFKGKYLDELIAVFRRALDQGLYEDELRVSPDSVMRASWIYRRLVRSSAGLAMTVRDISERKAYEQALSDMANVDALTSLPNRHWVMTFLPAAVEQSKNSSWKLAVLFIDLDNFKNINDALGHAAGDELLKSVAVRLKSLVRSNDHVVRLGGDEFTVILEQIHDLSDVSKIAGLIIKALGEPFSLAGTAGRLVRASVGISMLPQDGEDADTLLKHADIAMYAAKAAGKGCYRFYAPHLSRDLLAKLNAEGALRLAIENDEFVLHYQPRINTFSGNVTCLEALVRWERSGKDLVHPSEFIRTAEETGLIRELGEQIFNKACAQLRAWKSQGVPAIPISVNVSAAHFRYAKVESVLAACISRYQVDPSLLQLELTESSLAGDDNAIAKELAAVRQLGVRLLVDDFGTSHSSLSQLQRLHVDVLKIDNGFTARLTESEDGRLFFKAIISMAHALGILVVAEGVETLEQLDLLRALRTDEIQGHFIAPSLPPEDIPAVLQKPHLFPAAAIVARPADRRR